MTRCPSPAGRHSGRQTDESCETSIGSSRRNGHIRDPAASHSRTHRPDNFVGSAGRAAGDAGARSTLSGWLGPRVLPAGDRDARAHLDRLAESRALEVEGSCGPTCFGPRIRQEPFPKSFTLPRDTPKYNGTTKPEDWLVDYSTAIGIADGNKRIAVRYAPLMLQGSARTWLNSLRPNSINAWLDFEEAFVRNFTSTYRRPGRPR